MTGWLEGKYLAFDLETTSRFPEEARVVTATTILIDPVAKTKDVATWLSNVDGEEIPAETTEIHGITTEHAHEHGQAARDVVAEVADAIEQAWDLGIPVIGHNVGYDFTVLDCELRRHWPRAEPGGVSMRKAVLDTFVIDKHFSRRKGKRQLVPTAAFYGVPLSESQAHDATADALASARVLWVMARRYSLLAERSLDELFDLQTRWHREQQASLEDYFRREGIDREVSYGWPIRQAEAVTQ